MGLFAAIKRSAKECGAPRVLQVGGFPAELFPQPCFQAKTARYAERRSSAPHDPRARQAALEHLQPQAGRSAQAMAQWAPGRSASAWPRCNKCAWTGIAVALGEGATEAVGGMSCSTPLRVARGACDLPLGGESSPATRRVAAKPLAQAAGLSRATCRRSAGSRAGGGRWRGTRHSPLRRRRRRCLFRRRPWSPVR